MRARRAILNSIAGLLDYGARILLALILAPVMVRYLGADSFGIWQLMLKLGDQIMPADGRPQDVIRWRLATLQGASAEDEKRRIVAGSFAVWLMFFPLLLFCFWLSCQYLLNLDQVSKLAVLRIACQYIMALAQLAGLDYSADQSAPSFSNCIDALVHTIQTEGRIKRKL